VNAPQENQITVSVVIPTWNRRELLREALQALHAQTLPPGRFEIIVCDDGSTDGTAEMVKEFQELPGLNVIYHRLSDNRGPARARNIAVGMARGEIIAFTDSDCRVDSHWLEHGITGFADDKVAIVTGAIFHKPEQQITYFCRSHDPVTEEHPSYPAQNAMFRKRVFLELNGFEETLCFRNFRNRQVECADTDLAWRIKEAGYRTVFLKNMVVYHEIELQTPINWIVEPFRLFVVPALLKRHPDLRPKLLRWGLFFGGLNVPFYVLAAGLLLALAFWNPLFLIMVFPYFYFMFRAGYRRYSFSPLKMAGWVALMTMRQAACCAGLLYGSVRFRELVL